MKFLEEQLNKDRFARLIAAPWATFLAAGGIGLFTIPDPIIRTSVITILCLLAFAWLALLVWMEDVLRRRSEEELAAELKSFTGQLKQINYRANLYARSLVDAQKKDPARFTIELWDDSMTVEENGDTTIVRDMILLAGDRPLDLVSSTAKANDPANRELVHFEAFWLEENGDEGVPIQWTSSWSDDDKEMSVFLHYKDSIKPQTELRLRLRWTWPKYSRLLIEGKNEEMTYTFNRDCKKLRFNLTLDRNCKVNSTIRVRPFAGTPAMPRISQPDGSQRFEFEVRDLKPGTVAGFEAGSALT